MTEPKTENPLLQFICFSFFSLFIYPFAFLEASILPLIVSILIALLAAWHLCKYLSKSFLMVYFSITIVSLYLFTFYYAYNERSNSNSEKEIKGIILEAGINKNKRGSNMYAYFTMTEYPNNYFISKDYTVIKSFEKYVLTNEETRFKIGVYDKQLYNLNKTAQFKVKESHLNWTKNPFVKFFKKIGYPVNVEVNDFELIE